MADSEKTPSQANSNASEDASENTPSTSEHFSEILAEKAEERAEKKAEKAEERAEEVKEIKIEMVEDKVSEAKLEQYEESIEKKKLPIGLKVYGILCIVGGAVLVPMMVLVIIVLVLESDGLFQDMGDQLTTTTFIIFVVEIVLIAGLLAMFIVLGVRLLRNKRRHAATQALFMIAGIVAIILCDILLEGLSTDLIVFGIVAAFLLILSSYLDPALSKERRLHHQESEEELHKETAEGTIGRDQTGKGYITLNFFNLFWIFVICCILGLIFETVTRLATGGGYQNRTGMLYGPFSPIYGVGAVLMTIALNRFHKRNFIIIFVVSALIGGVFEYFVSWFMQTAFGIVAWDYSGMWGNIGGRTDVLMMLAWGALGLLWIKVLLPLFLKLINLIPWNWRYIVTTVCAILMAIDGGLTLLAYDCWYEREAGLKPVSAIEQFCAENYDNDFMKNHFQSMTINPDDASRSTQS